MAGQYPEDDFLESQSSYDASGPLTILGMSPIVFGMVLGVGGFFVTAIIGFATISPLTSKIDATEKDIQQKQTELSSTNEQIKSLEKVEADLESSRGFSSTVERLLPRPDNIDTQLLEINRLAEGSRAQLETFEPAALIDASSPEGPAEVPELIRPQIKVQNSKVGIQGEYDAIIDLMRNIELLETLLPIQDLSIRLDPPNGNEPPSTELTTEFSVRAYIYDKAIPLAAPSPDPSASPQPGATPAS